MPEKKKDITASQRTRRWHGGVAAINNASAASDIPDILAVWGKKLDLDMEGYNSLADANKALVDAAIYAGIGVGGYASREELAAVAGPIISKRVIVERTLHLINSVSEPARYPILLKQYGQWLGVLGIDLTDFNRLFEGTPTIDDPPADATGKWAVYEAIYEDKPYDSEDDLKTAFNNAVAAALASQAVAAVNSATAEEMGAVLVLYAVALTLDLTDYEALDEAKKGSVHEALVGKDFADAAAVKTAFDAAVTLAQGE